MSTRLALVLFALVCGLIALDLWMGWGGALFAARLLAEAIRALAFWR